MLSFFTLCVLATQVFAYQNSTATRTTPLNALDRRSQCSAGSFGPNGNDPCAACTPGSYSNAQGARACSTARPGYYIPTSSATAESTCRAGTYSGSGGSTMCSDCTPGHFCPNDALANPQQCGGGHYSQGGKVTACPACSAGTFNSIQGATGCCDCCAGWFLEVAGNANCQQCDGNAPYSNPGNPLHSQCSATHGMWAISSSCSQGNDGTCPASSPYTSTPPHRRRAPRCRKPGYKACPLGGQDAYFNLGKYDCVDIQNDLESCGGCVSYSLQGEVSEDGGRDCSAIPEVGVVSCKKGKCFIGSCKKGFVKSRDGQHCSAIIAPRLDL